MMNNLLSKQKQLLELIAKKHKNRLEHNPSSRTYIKKGQVVSYIKNHAFFLNEEINELILAIGNNDRAILKPWSIRHAIIATQIFESTDNVREEAIDMLCFCMNICLAAGLTSENIEAAYEVKWLENIDRQKRGY